MIVACHVIDPGSIPGERIPFDRYRLTAGRAADCAIRDLVAETKVCVPFNRTHTNKADYDLNVALSGGPFEQARNR